MNKINLQPSSHKKNTGWPFVFGLSAIEGILAAAVLISVPSESSVAFGLSPARLAILAAILLISITCAVFALFRIQQSGWKPDQRKICAYKRIGMPCYGWIKLNWACLAGRSIFRNTYLRVPGLLAAPVTHYSYILRFSYYK